MSRGGTRPGSPRAAAAGGPAGGGEAGPPPRDESAITPHRDRRSRRRVAGDIGLNLTSMIDVVFLLLVYFMVATEFRSGEEVYKLDLPDRSGAASDDPFELDEEPLRVEVRSRGPVGEGLSLSGAIISVPGPYPQPMDFVELRAMLVDLRVGGKSGLFPDDHPVVITATGDTRWQHALAAFNAAASAGFVNVSFGDES